MWNDEDNNPYGAFDNEAHLSDSLHSAALSGRKHNVLNLAVVITDSGCL